MSALFDDLLAVEGVKGVMFFSAAGELLFEKSGAGGMDKAAARDWQALLVSLDGAREADLIFEMGRLYIRKADGGHAGGDDGAHRPGRHDPFELRHPALGIEKPQGLRPALSRARNASAKGLGRFFQLPELYENKD